MFPILILTPLLAGQVSADCTNGDTTYMCWNIDTCWSELAFASREQLEFLCTMQKLPIGPGKGAGSKVVIVDPPRNITVPPGAEAQLACSADYTIKMTIQLQHEKPKLTSMLELPEGAKATSQKTIQAIDEAFPQHEGWYVCTAWGEDGSSVTAEAYLRIMDLCAVVECPGEKTCVADSYTGTYECVCPTGCDKTFDPVCASDCVSYYNECKMKKESCEKGLSGVHVVSRGLCITTPTDPIFYQTPTSERYREGVLQTFSARAKGDRVHYTWSVDGRTLGEGADFTIEMTTALAGEWAVTAAVCHGTMSVRHTYSVTVESANLKEPEMQCCKVYGDPHIITFDQVKYDYVGSCSYILAQDSVAEQWMVYGTFKPCGDRKKRLSCIVSITVFYGSEMVQFLRMFRVNYKGQMHRISAGSSATIGQMNVENKDFRYIVSLGSTDVKVMWDGMTTAEICLPKKCVGGVDGLCANADCNTNNEWAKRGTMNINTGSWVATTSSEFANSWAVQETGCDLEPEDGALSVERTRPCDFISDTKRAKYEARCQEVLYLAVFQNCVSQADIDMDGLMANCMFDSCAGFSMGGNCPGDKDMECNAATESKVYAAIAGGMPRAEAIAMYRTNSLNSACAIGMGLANNCRAWGAFISKAWRTEVNCPSDDALSLMTVCP